MKHHLVTCSTVWSQKTCRTTLSILFISSAESMPLSANEEKHISLRQNFPSKQNRKTSFIPTVCCLLKLAHFLTCGNKEISCRSWCNCFKKSTKEFIHDFTAKSCIKWTEASQNHWPWVSTLKSQYTLHHFRVSIFYRAWLLQIWTVRLEIFYVWELFLIS